MFTSSILTPPLNRITSVCSIDMTSDWANGKPDYVAHLGLGPEHIPALISLVANWASIEDEPLDDGEWEIPIHAWRALGQLQAADAVPVLVAGLKELDDAVDDWSFEEFPDVFGLIGPAAIEPVDALLADASLSETTRNVAARGLREIGKRHPQSRDDIIQRITRRLEDRNSSDYWLNAAFIKALIELDAVESAETIERAFAAGHVDEGVLGDWETVREELGVEGLGLPQPRKPHNSIEALREQFLLVAENPRGDRKERAKLLRSKTKKKNKKNKKKHRKAR